MVPLSFHGLTTGIWMTNCTKYGHGAVSDAVSSATAKLSAIISHQIWSWLPARSEDLLSMKIMLPKVVIGELDW